MPPLLLVVLVMGGLVGTTLLFASQGAGGGARPALPPAPPPRTPPQGGTPKLEPGTAGTLGGGEFGSPTAGALSVLPPEVEQEIAKLLAAPTIDPAVASMLATQLEQQGFEQVASLLRAKIAQVTQAQASGGGGVTGGGVLREMWVRATSGLHVRSGPSVVGTQVLATVPFGHTVTVVDITPTGWAQIKSQSSDRTAFVCHSCAEAPGGPWLVEGPPPGQPAEAAAAVAGFGGWTS